VLRVRVILPAALGTLLLAVALPATIARSVSPRGKSANRNGIRLKLVGKFDVPTYISGVGQDPSRIVVVERRGTIRMVHLGQPLRKSFFLDIRKQVSSGGERGLLSIAFAPNYALSGIFYVYYTARNGALTIDEYRRSTDPDRADPRSRRLVIAIPHPQHNHNSGQLQFGPDGYLYAGTGDGGGSGDRDGHAQDLRTRLGKILRFDPSGTVPRQRRPTTRTSGGPRFRPRSGPRAFATRGASRSICCAPTS
jgi:glucose/arabinose dehydrogenase